MFDFSIVTKWFDALLRQTCGLSNFWAVLIECVIVGLIVLTLYALIAMFMIYFERKVCAFFQCRLGPMRVGKWGIFQVVADVVKMLIKEIFGVDRSDKFLYTLAPFLTIIASVGTFSFLSPVGVQTTNTLLSPLCVVPCRWSLMRSLSVYAW